MGKLSAWACVLALSAAAPAWAATCGQTAAPRYPLQALRDDVGGVVHVTFTTGADGRYSDVQRIDYDHVPPEYRSSFRVAIKNALREYQCPANRSLSQDFEFVPEDAR
ncbi:hypothetical protein [Chromobacterium sp. IIBBL 290-4]|uniref:hypothetical protein n=1 Tax=Chromobacterium sp. IIBBL 290-4 TaxID=2953890 RepID=UPI0020B6D22A|nr:hypothetical protein [Chromobacterium sp. IIBBL 290-4]UTH75079.1 hypothetical protein NKT35_02970 [Chromobacterium sp. IIBBL 290-4]